jgi:hypothetical protein
MDKDWFKVAPIDIPIRRTNTDYPMPTKAALRKLTKAALVDEVYRTMSVIREALVELGVARRTKGSELSFDLHFVGNTKSLLKAAWRDYDEV